MALSDSMEQELRRASSGGSRCRNSIRDESDRWLNGKPPLRYFSSSMHPFSLGFVKRERRVHFGSTFSSAESSPKFGDTLVPAS